MMVDSEDSPATPRRLSDVDTVDRASPTGDVDSDADIAQISTELQDEDDQPATPTATNKQRGPVPVIQYKDTHDNDLEGSELGSMDASSTDDLPRRAGSPTGSVGSTAYAASIQVNCYKKQA